MAMMVTNDRLTEVSALKKRFLALNRERLERTRSALRERQREFLDLLPLLFHANHPMLPGFISKQTPVGVSDYSPSKRVLDVAKRHVRSFDYKRRALPSYDIQAMFVMGSIGTVAYSDKSDLDIWLCHKPGITGTPLNELRQKAREIEKAATQLDLEIHFFIMSAEAFKQGRHDDLSSESSGTAQHYLLLEEFYRTGLLLAGRYPLWWLVPPHQESDYEGYVHELKHKRFIREDECIDFGGIPDIPSEEFFGAALWQLSKGIDSPYKSVLKLLLMEVYAGRTCSASVSSAPSIPARPTSATSTPISCCTARSRSISRRAGKPNDWNCCAAVSISRSRKNSASRSTAGIRRGNASSWKRWSSAGTGPVNTCRCWIRGSTGRSTRWPRSVRYWSPN